MTTTKAPPEFYVENGKVVRPPISARSNAKTVRRHKRVIFNRDNFTCQECGKKFKRPDNWDGSQKVPGLTLGHIIPRGLGGRPTLNNYKAECKKCNEDRGMTIWR